LASTPRVRGTLVAILSAMPDLILVATDLSPAADEALRQAHRRAAASEARLAVCHVLPSLAESRALFPELDLDTSLAETELPKRARQALIDRVRELTGRDETRYELVVADGKPDTVILETAEARGAKLIVVGGTGAGAFKRALLGSVAERVVRGAKVAVLVARPSSGNGPVLAGTDFSDPTLPALAAGQAEAKARGTRAVFVHSLELGALVGAPTTEGVFPLPPDTVPTIERQAEKRLTDAAAMLGATDADLRVGIGEPGGFLVELAEQTESPLVVVGTHGRKGIARFLLGSVAERVVRHAPCSVLVVPLASA
jgi:nucleotide-binding universal stress UspA family protein